MKKKVLFINGNMNAGGVERSLADLLKHLDYSEYDLDLLLLQSVNGYVSELPKEVNVIFHNISLADGRFLKSIIKSAFHFNKYSFFMRLHIAFPQKFPLKKLKKIFGIRKKYDAVIAYRPGTCADIAQDCIDADKKILWWHHGDVSVAKEFKDSFLWQLKTFDKIVSVSDSMKKLLCREFKIEPEKVAVIPNMVDVDLIKEKSKEVYNSLRKENTLNILSVGRLSAEKNYIVCPEICRTLEDNGKKVNWIMIGDGDEKSEIIKKSQELGVEKSFVFLGNVLNPYVYYDDADVFVHPSLVESQCISILETMALGVPVVAVKSNGPIEYMNSGNNGYLCCNNVQELCDAILKICNDKNHKEQIIRNAKITVKEFLPEIEITKTNEIL